ncbi:MAG: type II secretion system F family protein [bacterium]
MSRFIYKARKETGELIDGEIEAMNAEEADRLLASRGFTPVKIEDKGMILNLNDLLAEFSKVKSRDLSVFFRQLSSIFSAGVPLYESLIALENQVSSGNLKNIVKALILDVEAGSTFSQALAMHPLVFSKLIVTMVEAGERGGVLGDVLGRISIYLEKEGVLEQKIKSALRYPTMVITSLGLAFIFTVAFIIPKFNATFASFKTQLPLPTRILLGLNFIFTHYWYLLIGGFILAYAVFKMLVRQPAGRMKWDKLLLNLPGLGAVIVKISLSRFFRMLSSMISSGIPLIYSLEVTAGTADNSMIGKTILEIRDQIMSGGSMSSAMKNYKLFPSTAYHMVAVGERSGTLGDMLVKAADYFDEETEYTVSNLMSLIEPLLVLVLALMVLLLALGIFLPMWNLMSLYS